MDAREAEDALLGGILYRGDLDSLRKVAQVVTPADFSDRGRVVWAEDVEAKGVDQ